MLKDNKEISKGVYIPEYIRFDKRLSHADKYILGELYGLARKKGYVWATNKYLCEVIDISESTLKRHLATFSSLKLISTTGSNIDRRIYFDNYLAEEYIERTLAIKRNQIQVEPKIYKWVCNTCLDWVEHGGTNHAIKKREEKQSRTIANCFEYATIASKGLLHFYDAYSSMLDEHWLKKYSITRELIIKVEEELKNKRQSPFTKALETHYSVMEQGKGMTVAQKKVNIKEDFMQVTFDLNSFFLQQKAKKDKESVKPSFTSWALYWLCKPYTYVEGYKKDSNKQPLPKLFEDLEHKFHMYEGMYKKFEKLFGESDDTTLLTEAYIITLKGVEEVSESHYIKPIEAFNTIFRPMVVAIDWMDNLNPKAFMPGRKMWVDFIHKYKDSNSFVKNAVNKYIRISNNDIEEIK